MEQPSAGREFRRVEDSTFKPKNLAQLKKALKDTGIWSQVVVGKKGDELRWDNTKLLKIFNDYKAGEREFFMSTYRNDMGETNVRLETGITTIRGSVFYNPTPQETLHLVQYFLDKEDAVDTSRSNFTPLGKSASPILKPGNVTSRVLTKKKDASISGKVNLKSDPTAFLPTLQKEMKEELGLETDSYTVVKTSPEQYTEEMSFGFPGLMTRQKFVEYKIRLDKNFQEEYIEIGHPQAVLGGWKTRVNVFRWELTRLKDFPQSKPAAKMNK